MLLLQGNSLVAFRDGVLSWRNRLAFGAPRLPGQIFGNYAQKVIRFRYFVISAPLKRDWRRAAPPPFNTCSRLSGER